MAESYFVQPREEESEEEPRGSCFMIRKVEKKVLIPLMTQGNVLKLPQGMLRLNIRKRKFFTKRVTKY